MLLRLAANRFCDCRPTKSRTFTSDIDRHIGNPGAAGLVIPFAARVAVICLALSEQTCDSFPGHRWPLPDPRQMKPRATRLLRQLLS